MSRMTKRAMRAAIAADVQANQSVPIIKLVASGKANDPKWGMSVTCGAVMRGVDFADDGGKVKTFQTLDAALKTVAYIAESSGGAYTLNLETGEFYASSVPSDIVAAAQKEMAKLTDAAGAQETKRQELSAQLSTMMSGWDNGNAAQRARYAEVVAQVGAIAGDINAIAARSAEISALLVSVQ